VVKIEAEDSNYPAGQVVEIFFHSVSRNLGRSSDLMTREKRGSAPRPSRYPHSRTENTRKIANRQTAINCSHPAVLTECVPLSAC
jgi:hypothetical protein